MDQMTRLVIRSYRILATTIAVLLFLTDSRPAEAGLTLESSSGSVTFGIFNTGGTSATAFKQDQNGNNTVLVAPGSGLPVLGTLVSGTSQSVSASTLSPYFLASATTTPASYGKATTEAYVANSGQQGSFTTQGGVYWSLNTGLADNLPANSGQASVAFSIAQATYQNLTGSNININPGSILSVSGTLGGSNSYVAAGLATTMTLSYGDGSTSYVLDTVVLAANSSGTNIAAKGSGPNEFASVTVSGNKLTGTGTSLYYDPNSQSQTITMYPNELVTITSYLTLISDPGSSIAISSNLPNGFPSSPDQIPDFGTFADSMSPATAVPEPSSLALLGGGLATAGIFAWKRRRGYAERS